MTKKIFRSILTVAVAVLAASFILVMGTLYGHFSSLQKDRLEAQISLAASAVETGGLDYLNALDVEDCRLTWISGDGAVLFDSQGDPEAMENHGEREEIREAFETGEGESSRYSATLTEETLYRARLLEDGTVLRASVSYATVPMLALGMLPPVAAVFLLALVLSIVLAYRLSEKITAPLNALDLERPLENNAYDEISPLLTHMEKQRREIGRQAQELEARQKEFYAVIENMREGLVLLNGGGTILSINPAARAFLSADADCVGKDFLTVERGRGVLQVLEDARETGRGELRLERGGREYQLNASRIGPREEPSGTALLIFDVTDKTFAERSRREFTANVSHELKTPVQSILGRAELLENGLAKPEDVPRFAESIHREASRLVSLIEDIIRLSQLDEGAVPPREKVDLYALAEEEVRALSPAAGEKGVSITLAGEPVLLAGPPQLFREIVHNLCDNAVKYNKKGGSAAVSVRPQNGGAFLIVEDTGIGIPPEDQDRIFERFYRVDKSRSKETGGTGLGLSIVKHAVQYLNGTVQLESAPGQGTKITVWLPEGGTL